MTGPAFSWQLQNWMLALAASVAIHPGVMVSIAKGYTGDSLFTLSGPESLGLIVLSASLGMMLIVTCSAKSRWMYHRFGNAFNKPSLEIEQPSNTVDSKPTRDVVKQGIGVPYKLIVLDVLSSLLLSVAAVLIAPQVHYFYYQLIFDSLPVQWVIPGDLSLSRCLNWFLIPVGASIAEHANGLMIWVCTITPCIIGWRYRRAFKRDTLVHQP